VAETATAGLAVVVELEVVVEKVVELGQWERPENQGFDDVHFRALVGGFGGGR